MHAQADRYLFLVDDFLREHIRRRGTNIAPAAKPLFSAMNYTLFSGGKRFRPMICFLAAEALTCATERIVPFASAVEMIHTYSLIHDDLPCMDDDDVRRGQPTAHIQYGEATALLAGDALLTEAFLVLSENYGHTPEVGMKLTQLLATAAGATGMIAGQMIDIAMLSNHITGVYSPEHLQQMHELKTGALIRVAVEGVTQIARAPKELSAALVQYGASVGLAFQIADDILDYDECAPEASGFPNQIGLAATQTLLRQTTEQALSALSLFDSRADGLRNLVEFNITRKN